MRVLNINCNGIRKRARRLQLAELLRKLRIGVRLVTETHLREEKISHLHFTYYAVVPEYCRQEEGKIAGGVLIPVHHAFRADRFDDFNVATKAVEHCAI